MSDPLSEGTFIRLGTRRAATRLDVLEHRASQRGVDPLRRDLIVLIHNTWRLSIVCAALLATPMNVLGDQTTDPAADEATPREISFQAEIEPIFSRHCYGCHQGAKQLGSYMMTEFDQLVAGGESEQPAIVPGKPDESYLVELITPVDGHAEMPDEPFKPLSQAEIELIRAMD